jgi:phage baseplate assembly protein W
MSTYRGFSTVNNRKKSRLTDFELAKQDLINHLYIKKGEKLHNPNFGSVIWFLLFEPFTDSVKDQIREDIGAIVDYDPRINPERIVVTEYEHGLQIELELTYIDTDETDTLRLRFNGNLGTLSVL